MQPHLKTAYILGAITARRNFEKEAAWGDAATGLAGGFLPGPIPAALVGGLTAPEGRGLGGAGGAGIGAALGQIGGGLGGAALGGAGGYGIGHLIKALGGDVDPATAARIGLALGAAGGAAGGGFYGAAKGRRAGIGEEHLKHSSEKAADAGGGLGGLLLPGGIGSAIGGGIGSGGMGALGGGLGSLIGTPLGAMLGLVHPALSVPGAFAGSALGGHLGEKALRKKRGLEYLTGK